MGTSRKLSAAATSRKRCSLNALRHGIFVDLVLSGGDFQEVEEQFVRLLRGLYKSIRPAGGLEEILVAKLAFLFLRLSRLLKVDAKLAPMIFEKVQEVLEDEEAEIVKVYNWNEKEQIVRVDTLRPDLLLRYESAIERQIERTLNQLERLQRMRLGQPVLPPVKVDVTS